MLEMFSRRLRKMHPATLVLWSFILPILLGTVLLMLPQSTTGGRIDIIDALFTATSAVCVTGLVVVDTGSFFTPMGQMIILFLIQLGGLGMMTFTVTLFHIFGRRVSIHYRMAVQDLFSPVPRRNIYGLLKSIFWFTGLAELSGAVLLFFHWLREFGPLKSAYYALFHSVSAFCNAGFALFPTSMIDYRGSVLLNLTMGSLIILGGLGFPVVYDLFANRFGQGRRRLSVQSKTVLSTSLVLIFLGMALFWVIERNAVLMGFTFKEKILTSFFQSVTCRTAGFNTVDIGLLNNATLTLMMFLMFIGASPGSCGGGVKTTTLAVLARFTWTRLKREMRVNMFKKSLPRETVNKGVALVLLSVGLIAVLFFCLLFLAPLTFAYEPGHEHFLAYLFEVVSAFGTVGLSMGATAALGSSGKIVIILMMLVGRVGVIEFAYVLAGAESDHGIEYSEEKVMIG